MPIIIHRKPFLDPSLFLWEITSEVLIEHGKGTMKYRGTIASDMSGKLGGIVASHNSYGTYFRRLVKPAQPRTPGQVAQRAAFGSISQQWRGLSDSERQIWISSAPQFQLTSATGNPILPTGQNLWMWVNAIRQRLGLAILTTPPATSTVPVISPYSFSISGTNTASVTFTPGDEWNASGGGMLLSVTAPIQPGRKFVETYVPLGQINGVSTSPQTFTLPYAYTPSAGLQVKMRASATVPDGRRSQPTFAYLFPPTPDIVITAIAYDGSASHTGTVTFSSAPLINATATLSGGAIVIPGVVAITAGSTSGTFGNLGVPPPANGALVDFLNVSPTTGTGISYPQTHSIVVT